jgi:hypothetical protein
MTSALAAPAGEIVRREVDDRAHKRAACGHDDTVTGEKSGRVLDLSTICGTVGANSTKVCPAEVAWEQGVAASDRMVVTGRDIC